MNYPPAAPEPYWVWCDFPRDSDHLVLQIRKPVGEAHEAKVANNPGLRRRFILEILKHASLAGLDPHFALGGRRGFYWEFRHVVYYDGFAKDQFFRRYRVLGATGHYLHAYFAHLFLKDGGGKDGAGAQANAHLYL